MLLQNLQSCGLTKSEAQIYLALLQKKEFAASEISSVIPVGRTRIYEIIPLLIAKGLCSEIQKNGKKVYCAVEPKIALQNLTAYYQHELDEEYAKKREDLRKRSETFKYIEKELKEIHSNNNEKTDVLDYIEIIKDRNQIREKWQYLQNNTKSEVLAFSKAPYVLELPDNIKNEKKVIRKKACVKGIYEYRDVTPESKSQFIKLLEAFQSLGEEVRLVDCLPMKLAVFDEKHTMIALNDPISMKPSITTIVVHHPSFAHSLKKTFESYWNSAITLKEYKKLKHI